MSDENEQRIAYERIINNKFTDIVNGYGERPLLDDGDAKFIAALDEISEVRNHPSEQDFVKMVFSELNLIPEGPEDYYDCYHDPLRWRCKARRAPRTHRSTEYPLD